MLNMTKNVNKSSFSSSLLIRSILSGVISGVISFSFFYMFNAVGGYFFAPGIVFGFVTVLCLNIFFNEVKIPFASKVRDTMHIGKAALFILGSVISYFVAVFIVAGIMFNGSGVGSTATSMLVAGAVGAVILYGFYCWLVPDKNNDNLLFGLVAVPIIGAAPSLIFFIPDMPDEGIGFLVLFIIWQSLMLPVLTWRYQRQI